MPYVALGAVCFFWGTTYLGIRMALESFPVLLLVAVRFLLSGTILLAWSWYRGYRFPARMELIRSALFGVLMLGVANGCVTMAEQWIPSGLAALLLTTAPFWLVGLEALMPAGDRLTVPIAVGLLIGLAGVVVLVFPTQGMIEVGPTFWKGVLVLQVASFFWNAGSIMQRRWRATTHPMLTGAIHQFAAGAVYLVLALLMPGHAVEWTSKGIFGLVWLVIFGSIVGYNAYIYALETLPVSLVSIYTYLNPVVAVILGKLVYDEPFGTKEMLAMAVIFAGVFIVKARSVKPSLIPVPAPSQPEPRPRSSTV